MSRKLIRLSKSCLSDSEKKSVMNVLDKEFLGMGAEVEEFEHALTEFFGRPTVCVVSGTAALHLALQACGIRKGDEVIVPSLTYVASFQSISATGATPIACDISTNSLLLDLSDAEKRITSRTKAIMPVHYSGDVGDINALYAFAKKHGLRVIEDAAHAFGSVFEGKRVGSFGDIACFSFDGIKNITAGEGGCIVTDDERILSAIKDARLLGVEKDTDMRFSGQRSWDYDVSDQGWRYHMSNIMAAIGLEQLKRFPLLSAKRREVALLYDGLLKSSPCLTLLDRNYYFVVPHIYVVLIEGIYDRDKLRANLLSYGIQTGIHYLPNHKLSLYNKSCEFPLPKTELVYSKLLTLPLHPDLYKSDVEYVCEKLRLLLEGDKVKDE